MCYFEVILLSDVISSIGPKISDADTNVHSIILWQTCIKMLGRSNKCSEYYPMTDLYKNIWTFEQMFLVLSYDRPVQKCQDVRTNILSTILWQTCIKLWEVWTNVLSTILLQTCIKMFGRSNKYSEYYPMTYLYKNVWTLEQMFWVLSYDWPVQMFGLSNKCSEYYTMTYLYKHVWTFEHMFWVLSYDWPV